MNRFYYPSAKDRETRVREVQAPAQGHTAQKHQAESPTPLCLMLQLDQPKLPSLASWKEEQGEECLWGVAISCIRILKTKVKQKKKKKFFFGHSPLPSYLFSSVPLPALLLALSLFSF